MSKSDILGIARGLKPVYSIWYFVEDGIINIFAGTKSYPVDDDDRGNLIKPCFGGTRPDKEVIEVFEKREEERCRR